MAPLAPAVGLVHARDLRPLGGGSNPHRNQERLCQAVGMVLSTSYPTPGPPPSPGVCTSSFSCPRQLGFPSVRGDRRAERRCPRPQRFLHSVNGLARALSLALETLQSVLARILVKKSDEGSNAGEMAEVWEELSPGVVPRVYLRHGGARKHAGLVVRWRPLLRWGTSRPSRRESESHVRLDRRIRVGNNASAHGSCRHFKAYFFLAHNKAKKFPPRLFLS